MCTLEENLEYINMHAKDSPKEYMPSSIQSMESKKETGCSQKQVFTHTMISKIKT